MPSDPYKGEAGRAYSIQEALNKAAALMGGLPDYFIPQSWIGAPDGVCGLDGDALIPTANLPPLAISQVFVVASEVEMLALTAEVGDVAKRTDIGTTFMLKEEPATVLANWIEIADFETSFLALTDTPSSFVGHEGEMLLVAEGEAALAFSGALKYNFDSDELESWNDLHAKGGAGFIVDSEGGHISVPKNTYIRVAYPDYPAMGMRYNTTSNKLELSSATGKPWTLIGAGLDLNSYDIVGISSLYSSSWIVGEEVKVKGALYLNDDESVGFYPDGDALHFFGQGLIIDDETAGFLQVPIDRPIYFDGSGQSKTLLYNSTLGQFELNDDLALTGSNLILPTNSQLVLDGATAARTLKYNGTSARYEFSGAPVSAPGVQIPTDYPLYFDNGKTRYMLWNSGGFMQLVGEEWRFNGNITFTGAQTVDGVRVSDHKARHENGGADQISVAGLTGTLATAQTPVSHASTHNGGADPVTPAGIGAEPAFSKNTAFNKNFGSIAGTVCEGNDARLSDARTPTAHKDSHKSGGSDALASTDLLEAIVKRLQVTGPVTLLVGAVADGEYLRRSGTALIGAIPGAPTIIQDSNETETTTTNIAWTQLRRFTKTLETAKYLVQVSCEVGNSLKDKDTDARVQINDTIDVLTEDFQAVSDGDYHAVSASYLLDATAGSYDFDLDMQAPGGGTAKLRRARLFITKVVI